MALPPAAARSGAWFLRALAAPLLGVAAARGQLLPFAGVAFGLGIAVWFGCGHEPDAPDYAVAALLLAAGALVLWRAPDLLRPLGGLALALAAGFLLSGLRAHLVNAPMLGFRYYGPVEGRVIEIDRSGSDALRLTLDRVVLERLAPAQTPRRVRISLHGKRLWHDAAPGETVMVTAHLSAPDGPAEPGGFDFRRMAFFNQIGAVGYSRTPLLLLEPVAPAAAGIDRLRRYFAQAIRAHIGGEAGAFAAGAMTGDRSGISQATVVALRDSSLAHILAISGMNLAFLVGFVFALIRGAVALVPVVALRLNAKKLAAAVSLLVALFYLLLSGANVATERAFYMVAVMLGAVLLDRRAITLRSATIAGFIVLGLHPESLTEPGFQMSFAATLALIAGFQALDRHLMRGRQWPRWAVMLFSTFASSLIGGLATAPYAAAHFNRFADYGLLANMLTVPAMGIAIMPMGVLAFLLAPFGLAGLPLWVMGLGAEWILYVAYRIAALQGAVIGIPSPAPLALALLILAGLWLILWPGRARMLGVFGLVLGLALWPSGGRPKLLIASDGQLLGWLGPQGRALSAPRGGSFTARNWLENDGDLVAPELAAARPGFTGPASARQLTLSGLRIIALSGKVVFGKAASGEDGSQALAAACAAADLVILAATATGVPKGCAVLDQRLLRQTGALALWHTATGLELQLSNAEGRIWQAKPPDLAALAALLPPGIRLAAAP